MPGPSSIRATDKSLLLMASLLALTAGSLSLDRPFPSAELSPQSLNLHIDINEADAPTLQLLPGVGPATARKIIDDRQQSGPYRTIDQLQRISGIGPKTVEGLRPWATINPIAPDDQ